MHWFLKKKKPKMKENLTSGMPENLEHILFAWTVLVFGALKKNNWSIISCFKIMTEVFWHFTWSSCSSCGICLSPSCFWYWYMFFLAPSSVSLKWYWILITSCAEFSVLLGNASHLALDQILFICVSILGTPWPWLHFTGQVQRTDQMGFAMLTLHSCPS